MKKYCLWIYLLFALLLLQCKKDNLSLKESYAVIQDCQQNLLSDSLEIVQHLIGKWKLIALGCGECIISKTVPNSILEFKEKEGNLTIKNAGKDNIDLTFGWTLERYNISTEVVGFQLKTNPKHTYLSIDAFCYQYMFYDDSHFDGGLVIFEKQ